MDSHGTRKINFVKLSNNNTDYNIPSEVSSLFSMLSFFLFFEFTIDLLLDIVGACMHALESKLKETERILKNFCQRETLYSIPPTKLFVSSDSITT